MGLSTATDRIGGDPHQLKYLFKFWPQKVVISIIIHSDVLENSPLTFSRFLQGCECRRQWLFTWLYHNGADIRENQTLLPARVRLYGPPRRPSGVAFQRILGAVCSVSR